MKQERRSLDRRIADLPQQLGKKRPLQHLPLSCPAINTHPVITVHDHEHSAWYPFQGRSTDTRTFPIPGVLFSKLAGLLDPVGSLAVSPIPFPLLPLHRTEQRGGQDGENQMEIAKSAALCRF